MAGILKFTPIALKNLFSKPVTRAYPDVPARQAEGTRGAVQVSIDDCIFCGMCNRCCPADAITVDRSSKTWTIQRMSCVQCGYCVSSCPKKCLTMEGAYSAPGAEKREELFQKTEVVIPAVHTLAPAPADGKPIAPDRVLVADLSTCVLCGLCMRRCPTGALQVDRKAGTWTIDRSSCLQCGNCVNGCPKNSLALVPDQGQPKVETYTKSIEKPAAAPAAVTAQPKGVEGISVDLSTCILCGLCVRRCPTSAIAVDRAKGTWSINRQSCVVCGNCLDVCHKHSLFKTDENIATDGVQVYQKAETLKEDLPKAEAPKEGEPKTDAVKAQESRVENVPAKAPSTEPSAEAMPIKVTAQEGICVDMSSCVLCGICAKKCPTIAIEVDRATKIWTIRRDECVLCENCISVCPKKSLTRDALTDEGGIQTYAKPEVPKAAALKTEIPRGDGVQIDMSSCVLCGICAKQCPTNAIEVDRKAKIWTIRRGDCTLCENCVDICPKDSLSKGGNLDIGMQTYEKPVPKVEVPKDAPKGEGVEIDMSSCVLCGICAKKCPTSAIAVDRQNKTWTIHRSDCTLCESCVTACPKKSLTKCETALLETYIK